MKFPVIFVNVCTVLLTIFDQSFEFLLDDQNNQTAILFNDDVAEALDIDKEFCPMTCKESNITDKDRPNLCCIKCDCSQDCVAARTCCVDAPSDLNPIDYIQENCVQTAIGDKRNTTGIVDIDAYMLIQFCKSEAIKDISDDVITKCLQADEDKIEEILPVYSDVTEKNYRNIFCAMCNDDHKHAVPWESRIICNTFLPVFYIFPKIAESSVLLNIRHSEHCFLQIKPNNDKASECIDSNALISDCSFAPFSNPELINLCSEMYSPVMGEMGIYKNVHCLHCNEGDFTLLSICRDNVPPANVFKLTNLRIELYSQLYYDHKKPSEESSRCMTGSIYDKRLVRMLFSYLTYFTMKCFRNLKFYMLKQIFTNTNSMYLTWQCYDRQSTAYFSDMSPY
jgi:hypothetical protein